MSYHHAAGDILHRWFANVRRSFIHLVSHRFASHCCEALFLRAAPFVTEELLVPENKDADVATTTNGNDAPSSMEDCFLRTLDELEGNVGYLLTNKYASHALRALLLVFSGESIDNASTKNLLQSKRKENTTVQGADFANAQSLGKTRTVPESFSKALEKLIADSTAGLDTDQLRALATHQHANPTLQLLLKLELTHLGKHRAKDERSTIRKLLPDDSITADSKSAVFISDLVYDPVGSHLIEKIVEHAPAKMFKGMYFEFFKERLASYARNEVAGYVVCRILERLGHDDLLQAHESLVPMITNLLEKNRTMVVRTLIERCTIRDIDNQAIAVQIDASWRTPERFEVEKLLKYGSGSVPEPNGTHDGVQNGVGDSAEASLTRCIGPIKVHFNLLAQAMLLVPGSLSALVIDSLVMLDFQTILDMARDSIVSRTLQAALTTRNASIITRRKLIQQFYGHIGEMAIDASASHVVDCIWEGTHGLAFIRERVAEELAENEAQMREQPCGRAVWKNWKMDLYKRRRGDWIHQSKVKASNDGFQSFSELDINKEKGVTAKTPLQLARERHAKGKWKKDARVGSGGGIGRSAPGHGANGTAATATVST